MIDSHQDWPGFKCDDDRHGMHPVTQGLASAIWPREKAALSRAWHHLGQERTFLALLFLKRTGMFADALPDPFDASGDLADADPCRQAAEPVATWRQWTLSRQGR